MRHDIVRVTAVIAFASTTTVLAQSPIGDKGVPSEYTPPPGQCRVWYDDRPAEQQPPPTDCRAAERAAAAHRYGRVIVGTDRDILRRPQLMWRDGPGWSDSEPIWGTAADQPRAMNWPLPWVGSMTRSTPLDNGYVDGLREGRRDALSGRSYAPTEHRTYADADSRYRRHHGARDTYKAHYRQGFFTGYASGYGLTQLTDGSGASQPPVRRAPPNPR
jgi:hypothetical protein